MATKRKTKQSSSRTPQSTNRSSSRTLQSQQRSGIQVISPCLWFDSQAEEAARFYVSVFKKGKIVTVNRYPAVGQDCPTQKEIDYYWDKLGEGGDPNARQCGWLKDKFGLSWQVAPTGMAKMFKNPKSKATEWAFAAMMQMKKIDIAALESAFKG